MTHKKIIKYKDDAKKTWNIMKELIGNPEIRASFTRKTFD